MHTYLERSKYKLKGITQEGILHFVYQSRRKQVGYYNLPHGIEQFTTTYNVFKGQSI